MDSVAGTQANYPRVKKIMYLTASSGTRLIKSAKEVRGTNGVGTIPVMCSTIASQALPICVEAVATTSTAWRCRNRGSLVEEERARKSLHHLRRRFRVSRQTGRHGLKECPQKTVNAGTHLLPTSLCTVFSSEFSFGVQTKKFHCKCCSRCLSTIRGSVYNNFYYICRSLILEEYGSRTNAPHDSPDVSNARPRVRTVT